MSIQSTTTLTRIDAELLFVEQYTARNMERIVKEVQALTDEELENFLESTFDNYLIVRETEF